MRKQRIFQINTELHKVTGIQRVILDIHAAIKDVFEAKIVGLSSWKRLNQNLHISENEYLKLSNPFILRNSIVIVHERRLLPFMWILTHIPFLNIKCIYVHHNELYGNKFLSLFPKHIIAISDAGIQNLTTYFNVPYSHITKIHNCVIENDTPILRNRKFSPEEIRILYPARINQVKRQIEIVNHLKDKIDKRVKIHFAGIGPQYDKLKELCQDDDQFSVLGFCDNIQQLMCESYDFVMLFSKHEGLPISLIEANKVKIPIICNNVGGNQEIVSNGINGIIAENWDTLISTINKLPTFTQYDWDKMSQNSYNIFLHKFNFETFKERYLNLLNSLK